MKLKIFLALAGLIAVFAVIIAIKAKQFAPPPEFEFPPEVVSTVMAEAQQWEQRVATVGSLRARHGIMVSAEVGGIVQRIHFESGARVEAGDILVELEGGVEQAQLRAAEASATLARLSLKRAEELRANDTIAQAELDAALAAAAQAEANVDNLKAAIARKVVRAPFAGRLGIRQVDPGEFLAAGAGIVSLQAVDPMLVDFALPQRQVGAVAPGYVVRLRSEAHPDEVFRGEVVALNPELDGATRTLQAQARVANADERLRPGMFVRVEVIQPGAQAVVVIPATAVYYQSFGNTVFVVKPAEDAEGQTTRRVVEQRVVRLGPARGDFVAVETGVAAGEEVVSFGVFKLRNGAAVAVDNARVPELSLDPAPSNG
jgi:membrane fusion protein (multidrug efflux system)